MPRIFIRFHRYHPAAALHLIVGNTEQVLDHLRRQQVGLGLVAGHQRSPGVRLEPFMPDEIIPVCAPRIPDTRATGANHHGGRYAIGTSDYPFSVSKTTLITQAGSRPERRPGIEDLQLAEA